MFTTFHNDKDLRSIKCNESEEIMMSLEKIERLHSNTELALAVIDNWCEKHQQKPQFCGATKEARELLGDVLKGVGVLLFVAALFKGLK